MYHEIWNLVLKLQNSSPRALQSLIYTPNFINVSNFRRILAYLSSSWVEM
jgi:hypothetical protein